MKAKKINSSSPVDRVAIIDDNGQATFSEERVNGQRHRAPCSVARRACCFRCCCWGRLVRTWVVLTRQRDDSLSPPQPTIRTDQSQTSSWLIDCASAAAGLCWRDLRSSIISIASMHPRSYLADVRIPLLKSVQASPNGTTAHNDKYFRVMTRYGMCRSPATPVPSLGRVGDRPIVGLSDIRIDRKALPSGS